MCRMRRLTTLIALSMLLDTVFSAALAPLLPRLAGALQLSKSQSGFLTAAFTLGTLLAALPAASLASRVGAKRTLILGLLVMASTTWGFAFADNIALLDAARFGQGIASALAWTGGLAWLLGMDAAGRAQRMGIAVMASLSGEMLGPAVGTAASLVGIRWSFGVLGTVALVLVGLAWLSPGSPSTTGQSLKALLRVTFRDREAKGLSLIGLASVFLGVQFVLAPLRLANLGIGPIGIGATFLVAAAIQAAFNPALGRYFDRRGRLGPVQLGLLLATGLSAALPWIGNGVVLAVAVAAANVSYGVAWVPGMTLVAQGSDDLGLDQALGVALMNLAWAGGYSVGAALGGLVAQSLSDAVPYTALALLCLSVIAMLRESEVRLPGAPLADGGADDKRAT